jgi:hypothetical protein
MAVFADRARMLTPTTGTGTITLGLPVVAFQSFAAAGIVDADEVEYLIEDGIGWEIGLGRYAAAGPTLSRTLRSSSTGALLALSGRAVVSVVPTALTLTRLSGFVFVQATPAATWTIIHNLARFPSVEVVDSAGAIVEGDVTYVSSNEIILSFMGGFSGTAYLN